MGVESPAVLSHLLLGTARAVNGTPKINRMAMKLMRPRTTAPCPFYLHGGELSLFRLWRYFAAAAYPNFYVIEGPRRRVNRERLKLLLTLMLIRAVVVPSAWLALLFECRKSNYASNRFYDCLTRRKNALAR